MLSESVNIIADLGFTPSPSPVVDVGTELGKCYLIANGLSNAEPIAFGSELTDEQRKDLMVELMPSLEYAMYSSPWHLIKKSLVRSEKLIARLQCPDLKFDANHSFFEASELTLHEFQHLVYGMLCVPLTFDLAEISGGTVGFIDTSPSPKLTKLYDKLLRHTCISIDNLAIEAKNTPSPPDAYLFWRKYPLVKISNNQIICVDIGFLMDKLETGLFWVLRNQLKDEKEGKEKEIFDLRGPVFQDYAGAIIQRGIDALAPTRVETCIISPKYNQSEDECTDIAVYSHETLVILECKASCLGCRGKIQS